MECPKCHFDHPLQSTECLRCGIIFSKYRAYLAANPSMEVSLATAGSLAMQLIVPETTVSVPEASFSNQEQHAEWHNAKRELIVRAIALPGALLIGWVVVKSMPM